MTSLANPAVDGSVSTREIQPERIAVILVNEVLGF
jgi:hypothetical protein